MKLGLDNMSIESIFQKHRYRVVFVGENILIADGYEADTVIVRCSECVFKYSSDGCYIYKEKGWSDRDIDKHKSALVPQTLVRTFCGMVVMRAHPFEKKVKEIGSEYYSPPKPSSQDMKKSDSSGLIWIGLIAVVLYLVFGG